MEDNYIALSLPSSINKATWVPLHDLVPQFLIYRLAILEKILKKTAKFIEKSGPSC